MTPPPASRLRPVVARAWFAVPEVLTRHPDTVIQVLKSAGAQCGVGAPQTILTECPRDSFCALPGGETCVYDIADVGQMTQISAADLEPYVCSQRGGGCSVGRDPGEVLLLLAGLLAGFALGRRAGASPQSLRARDGRAAAAVRVRRPSAGIRRAYSRMRFGCRGADVAPYVVRRPMVQCPQ